MWYGLRWMDQSSKQERKQFLKLGEAYEMPSMNRTHTDRSSRNNQIHGKLEADQRAEQHLVSMALHDRCCLVKCFWVPVQDLSFGGKMS
jgi:hypothetical protein